MKKLLLILPLLYSCNTTKKCDAYAVTVCDTLTFEPMHIHSLHGKKWSCDEFPADTFEIDRVVFYVK